MRLLYFKTFLALGGYLASNTKTRTLFLSYYGSAICSRSFTDTFTNCFIVISWQFPKRNRPTSSMLTKKVYQSLKECRENHFIFYMEKLEQNGIHYSDLLETKMDMEHVLQPQGDKSHLYNAYCACVEEGFKNFKKSLENSDLNDTKSFPKIVASLERMEEILKSHNKKPQTNPGESILTKDCLRIMESYSVPGCMIDGTLWIFGQNPEEKNEEVSELSKLMMEKYNIDVVSSSIILYRLYSGGTLSPTSDTSVRGSIGMFATLRKLGIPRLVCIGSGHICKENDTMYYKDGGESRILGTCLWPNNSTTSYLQPMSVVCLNEEVCSLVKEVKRKTIKIFEGELIELKNRKVYKIGATSNLTVGYIEDQLEMFSYKCLIVAGEKEGELFSDKGDSGAIVWTKIGTDTVALGIVVGSIENMDTIRSGSDLVVSLQDALYQFTEHYNCEIENPFLLL